MAGLIEFFRLFRGFGKDEQKACSILENYLSKKEMQDLKYLLKTRRIKVNLEKNFSKFVPNSVYPRVEVKKDDKETNEVVTLLKSSYEPKLKKELFSKANLERFVEVVAPNIVGFEDIKLAVLFQLFGAERFHILLLGDPATGKTAILHAANELAPVSSFGLGSGTTGAGLTVTISGGEVSPGLLAMADNGVCCIDELNLLKKEDLGSLYNAMEKGFFTYDKGKTHKRFDARIRLLATANPKGDSFSGDRKKVKQQLPFDQALLSRFHLVFFVKKPGKEEFLRITKNIIKHDKAKVNKKDVDFVKEYVKFAEGIDVVFDQKLESFVTGFVEKIKDDEKKFLITLSPRIVVGIINMCKARARMFLRNKVTEKDVDEVLRVFKKSLYENY